MKSGESVTGINVDSLFNKIEHAKEYKAEEVTTSEDSAYNTFLILTFLALKDTKEYPRVKLLSFSKDMTFIKNVVESDYQNLGLTNEDRIELLARVGDEEYIESILKGEVNIDLGTRGLKKLVEQNVYMNHRGEEREYFLKYACGQEYHFDKKEREGLLWDSKDEEATKEFLEKNEVPIFKSVLFLGNIKDKEYIQQYIEKKSEPLRMYLQDRYVNTYR